MLPDLPTGCYYLKNNFKKTFPYLVVNKEDFCCFLKHLFFSRAYLLFLDIFSGSQTGFTNANYKFLQASKYCYFVLILDLPRYARQAQIPFAFSTFIAKGIFIVFILSSRITHTRCQSHPCSFEGNPSSSSSCF